MIALCTLTASAYVMPAMAPPPMVARRAVQSSMILGLGEVEVDTPSTVGDAKVAFTKMYGRPVNGMQQGFVTEMLTGTTLALVQKDYTPSRVFYFGITSLCTSFLASVPEEAEREKLFLSICAGVGMAPKKLRAEAAKLADAAKGKTEDELFATEDLTFLASSDIKYSYQLGAGLLALMPLVDVEPSDEAIARWCEKLNLPGSRLQKDWAFYVDAQEKMVQAKQMVMEMAAAAKRKEAQKLKDDAEKAAKEAADAETAASE